MALPQVKQKYWPQFPHVILLHPAVLAMAIRHFGHNRTSLYSSLMFRNSSTTSLSVILPDACKQDIQ